MSQKITYILTLLIYGATLVLSAQIKKTKNVGITKPVEKNGYQIKINTKNLENQKLVLFYTYGIHKTKIITDSIQIKQKQEIVNLSQSKKIWGAIYQLELQSQKKSIQLAIDNGSKTELQLEYPTIDSLKIISKNCNTDFLNYQRINKPTGNQLTKFAEDTKQKFPNSVLDLYLQLEIRGHVDYDQPKNNFDLFIKNYLTGFDLTDSRFFLMPNLFRFMNNLVTSMPINNPNYKAVIDAFLKNLDCKDKTYKVMVDWFASNLGYNEGKQLEDSYKYLFEKHINIKDCDIFGDAKLSQHKNTYQGTIKLPQGTLLPEFTFVDKDSLSQSITHLYKESDYSLLVFFSPDCHHCIENVPKNNLLLDRLAQKYPKINLKRISILNDQDPKNWADFIKKSNIENWINLKDPSKKLDFRPLYNTYSNPNYIFVDKKGTVLLKTFNLKGMDEIISKTAVGE